MAHAEDFGPRDPRPQPPLRRRRNAEGEPPRTPAAAVAPKRQLRVNEITSKLGLTPITGLSGPKILY